MKKLLWIFLIFVALTSCTDKAGKYHISANLSDAPEGWAMLSKVVDGALVNFDSIQVKGGAFEFTGKIESPEMYYILFPTVSNKIAFFTEPAKILISGSVAEPKIEGSKTQTLFDEFQARISQNNDERNAIYAKYEEAESVKDTVTMKQIEDRFSEIDQEEEAFILNFAKKNNNSVVAPYIMGRYSYNYELKEIEDVFSNFGPAISDSRYYKNLSETIETMRKVEIGQPAPDFTQNDTLENPVALSSLRGKYVLVDFWASWCGPCRAENPNVVDAFRKYNANNFTVLGVSLDRDKTKWIQAIAADNLTWTHISDLKYWDNAAAKLYGVRSIPANFLLDPNGIIIGKNLRDQALQDKLAELFK